MDPVDLATFSVVAEIHSGIDASRLARMDRVVQLASSALAAPLAGYGEVELYPSLADKAAIYASRIMRNHPLPVAARRIYSARTNSSAASTARCSSSVSWPACR